MEQTHRRRERLRPGTFSIEQSVLKASEQSTDAFYERGNVKVTPLQEWRGGLHGCRVLEKREDQQDVRSFKVRGATMAILRELERNPDLKRVVTASAGNHAQGIGDAARQFGLQATIYAKGTISPAKASRIVGQGSELITNGFTSIETALEAAAYDAQLNKTDTLFVHPFDNTDVIAGQGTMMDEIYAQLDDAGVDLAQDEVYQLVPVGGGGLAGAAGIKAKDKNIKVIGVQMEDCDAMHRAIAFDRVTDLFAPEEFDDSCDGTAVLRPGQKTLAICKAKEYVDGFITVSKAQVGEAMHDLYVRYGVRVEPAGALTHAAIDSLSLAAGLARRQPTFVGVISGANVSDQTWSEFNRATMPEFYTPERKIVTKSARFGRLAVWSGQKAFIPR